MTPTDPIENKLNDIALVVAVSRIVNTHPQGFKVKLGDEWYELHAYSCPAPEGEEPVQECEEP